MLRNRCKTRFGNILRTKLEHNFRNRFWNHARNKIRFVFQRQIQEPCQNHLQKMVKKQARFVLNSLAMLRFASLCFAMLCYSLFRFAFLLSALLCSALLCLALLWLVLLCFALLCFGVQCSALPSLALICIAFISMPRFAVRAPLCFAYIASHCIALCWNLAPSASPKRFLLTEGWPYSKYACCCNHTNVTLSPEEFAHFPPGFLFFSRSQMAIFKKIISGAW